MESVLKLKDGTRIGYFYLGCMLIVVAYGGEGGASQVALMVKNPPAKARDERGMGSIPGLEDPLE